MHVKFKNKIFILVYQGTMVIKKKLSKKLIISHDTRTIFFIRY